jgi:GNAT superfamily N-acetyltransferase
MWKENDKSPQISIRYTHPDDKPEILSMLKETNFFRPQELLVAQEVLDDALAEGANGHYQSFAAEENGKLVGWICFGPAPCTISTFDIYWLVVTPQKQRNGVGAFLMKYAANLIKNRNGRLIVAETSGHPRYHSTRRFYEKMNYSPVSCIRDFYAPGDDKVIYVKNI